jgi:hypothetical protein
LFGHRCSKVLCLGLYHNRIAPQPYTFLQSHLSRYFLSPPMDAITLLAGPGTEYSSVTGPVVHRRRWACPIEPADVFLSRYDLSAHLWRIEGGKKSGVPKAICRRTSTDIDHIVCITGNTIATSCHCSSYAITPPVLPDPQYVAAVFYRTLPRPPFPSGIAFPVDPISESR